MADLTNLRGATIHGYRLESYEGSGDLGALYRATDTLGAPVAVRLITPAIGAVTAFQQRLREQSAVLSALSHPALAQTFAAGVSDGVSYVVSSWLPDGTLQDLATVTAETFSERVQLLRQAADGLAYLHGRGVLHGALSPHSLRLRIRGNVVHGPTYRLLVSHYGIVGLLDELGLDAPLSSGVMAYCYAPELAQGQPRSVLSDIYAFGALLFEAVVGHAPFQVDSIDAAVAAHVYTAAPDPRVLRPDLPAELGALLVRCLAKDPAQRYQQMSDVADALALLAGTLEQRSAQSAETTTLIAPTAYREDIFTTPEPPPPPRSSTPIEQRPSVPQVDGYLLNDPLGDDDLGRRYIARGLDGRPVSVRLLPAGLSGDPSRRAALLARAGALTGLRHPHLQRIDRISCDRTQCYTAGELLNGPTLRDLIAAQQPIDALCRIVADAADGLGAAHRAGIVHGGLRPDRITLIDGRSVVSDLGLEVILAGGSEDEPSSDAETLSYAFAPERAMGEALNAASDVYALGCLLFECVSGAAPFSVSSFDDAIMQHVYGALPAISWRDGNNRPQLQLVIERCLAKDPAARFRDGAELASALRAALATAAPAGSGGIVPAAAGATFTTAASPTTVAAAAAAVPAAAAAVPFTAQPIRSIADPAGLIGSQIAACTIERLVITSQSGSLFRAQHPDLGQTVALRILPPTTLQHAAAQQQFELTRRQLSSLRHRNLVETIEGGIQDGIAYLISEWLPDGAFSNVLQARARADESWTLGAALDLLRQTAEGLAFLHQRNIVHGMLRPSCLLLATTADGRPQIRITDSGLFNVLSSIERSDLDDWPDELIYNLAPEVGDGGQPDARSDIYALGIILYELATGSPPFTSVTRAEAIEEHRNSTIPAPSAIAGTTPPELERIILRCLAKAPTERYQQAAELARDLAALTSIAGLAAVTPRAPTAAAATPAGTVRAGTIIIPTIQVVDQYGRTLEKVVLSGDGVNVGAANNNELVVKVNGVAERHLHVDWDGRQANITVTAAGAATVLGDEDLVPGRAYAWKPGTTLRVGSAWLQLELSQPNTAQARAAERPASAMLDEPQTSSAARTTGSSSGEPAVDNPAGETVAPPRRGRRGARGAKADAEAAAAEAAAAASGTPPTADTSTDRKATVTHIGITLEQEVLTITPGRPTMFRLTLSNMGKRVDHLRLEYEGIPATWVQQIPVVQLNPGSQAQVTVSVSVTEDPKNRAGTYPVIIKAVSRDNPDIFGSAATQWVVTPFHRSSVTLRPRSTKGWRGGKYRLAITNEGNARARYSVAGEDDEGALEYRFLPGEIPEVEPGEMIKLQLNARSAGMRWFGTSARFSFNIMVKSQTEPDPLVSPAQFEQRPVIPAVILPFVIGGLTMLIIYGTAAPPALANMPGYRFLNPTASPTRTPPPTPTTPPTATLEPSATLEPTASIAPTPEPTLPPTETPIPSLTPIPPTPTPSPTPTIGPMCQAGMPIVASGYTTPNSGLVVYFGDRIVSGGVSDAGGYYRIRLDLGRERPGLYPVTVRIRSTNRIINEFVCVIPTPLPTINPFPPPAATPEA